MELEQQLSDEFDKQVSDIVKANLMVVGGTGVGKSSLINRVFGQEVAPAGTGKPVTKGCNRYESEHVPVVIFDTEGYEIISGNIDNSNFEREVIKEIKSREEMELSEQIHLYWYCISASNHRITDYDIENIKKLSARHANLAVVITQCDNEEVNDNNEGLTSLAFREVLEKKGIENEVFETSVTMEDTLQLDVLVEWSVNNLPTDKLKDAFTGAQRSNLPLKDKQANLAIVVAAVSSAGAAGLNPIPMSDSAALVPIQMRLAVRLAHIYGFKSLGQNMMALLKTQVVSLIGRQMAASLTKLIPVAGQFINAGVATGITTGLGYALMGMYRGAYEKVLETGKQPDWTRLFSNLDILAFIKKYIKESSVPTKQEG